MRLPLLPRRYTRHGTALVCTLLIALLLWANPSVTPVGKPLWAPWFGEPLAPTSRDTHPPPLPRTLTLHLVPHSHSDIGWNLSFQGYYNATVRSVLRRVTRSLLRSPVRRFTWGDLAFLDMWMAEEGDALVEGEGNVTWRGALARLAEERRMDVVGGTYVSPDEGLSTWWALNSLADVGRRTHHRLLRQPTSVGWQIDPFGHFARLPRLLANSGFTHLVLGRMSHDTLYALRMRHALQFLWQAKDTGGGGAAHHPLLTHFLSTHYAFPAKELDFDHTESCDVPRLLRVLRRYALQQVRQYPGHGHVLVMLGDDFRYVAAERAFACIDRLVAHQGLPGITLRYSTPSEYFASVEPHLLDPAQPLYRLKGDLYPYQDKPYEQYWAGILASRMRLKRAVRLAEHCVQHAEALVAASHVRARSGGLRDVWETTLEQHMEEARKQVAIGYHHDAITGTCSHTAYLDYLDRLQHAERTALRVARVALLLGSGQAMTDAVVSRELSTERRPELAYSTMQDHAHALDAALHVPASVCSAESCAGTLVVVSNAAMLAEQSQVVRLHVHSLNVTLVDVHTRSVVAPLQVEQADTGYYVSFVARGIPPMGVRGYELRRPLNATETRLAPSMSDMVNAKDTEKAVLEKNGWRVSLSTRGSRVRMHVQRSTKETPRARVVWHEMRQYFANPRVQASGAYVMHSFMLMYALVFYVFGASVCCAMALAHVVHGKHRQPAAEAVKVEDSEQQVGARMSVASEDSGSSLGLDEHVRASSAPPVQRVAFVWPAALGGLVGALFVYYVAQVADIERLGQWTVGRGHVALRLALPAFLLAYVPSAILRPTRRALVYLTLGLALGTVCAMFFFPTWQSRPLYQGPGNMTLRVAKGAVCDTAYVSVDERTQVAYRLCADRAPLVEVSVHVVAAENREVVEHFSLEQPYPWAGALSACRFAVFDGVEVVHREYRRWTPLPGNLYPAVSHVSLPGSSGLHGLTLHGRQPVGVTCVRQGMLELLVHRSMSGNDFRGLHEPLVDRDPAVVTHYVDLGLGYSTELGGHNDELQTNVEINAPPMVFLAPRELRSKLAYWSPLVQQPKDTLKRLRFVGVHASNRDLLNVTGSASPTGRLSVYARILALPDAGDPEMPVVVDRLFQAGERAYSVQGDWSIAPVSPVNRTVSRVQRYELLPARQTLFRVDLD